MPIKVPLDWIAMESVLLIQKGTKSCNITNFICRHLFFSLDTYDIKIILHYSLYWIGIYYYQGLLYVSKQNMFFLILIKGLVYIDGAIQLLSIFVSFIHLPRY